MPVCKQPEEEAVIGPESICSPETKKGNACGFLPDAEKRRMPDLRSKGKVLVALMLAALAAVAGVLIVTPAESTAASVLSPGFVKDLVESGEVDPESEKGRAFINESALSTVDIEADHEEAYKAGSWKDSFNKTDLKYLACIIYCEAGSMSNAGKVAVGNVVLNRLRNNGDWAHVNTIKEVIYDRKWAVQFSPTVNGSLDKALKLYKSMDPTEFKEWQIEYMEKSIEAAKQVMRGKKTVPDDFCYFNGYVDSSKKKCEDAGKTYRIIGGHIYF